MLGIQKLLDDVEHEIEVLFAAVPGDGHQHLAVFQLDILGHDKTSAMYFFQYSTLYPVCQERGRGILEASE